MTLRAAIAFALGFLQEHTPQSSARLVGVLLGVTGCGVAAFTVRFAFLHPDRATTVSALAATTGALLGTSFGSIWSRNRIAETPPPGDRT